MKNSIISFVICAILGLGVGYLIFDVIGTNKDDAPKVATNTDDSTKETASTTDDSSNTKAEPATASSDNILSTKGCLGCHSVSALNLQGGATGPDLSQAFNNVEGKHGKPINEFLKEPTSAVMSGVIGGNPLSDEEINQVLEVLKEASSK